MDLPILKIHTQKFKGIQLTAPAVVSCINHALEQARDDETNEIIEWGFTYFGDDVKIESNFK